MPRLTRQWTTRWSWFKGTAGPSVKANQWVAAGVGVRFSLWQIAVVHADWSRRVIVDFAASHKDYSYTCACSRVQHDAPSHHPAYARPSYRDLFG